MCPETVGAISQAFMRKRAVLTLPFVSRKQVGFPPVPLLIGRQCRRIAVAGQVRQWRYAILLFQARRDTVFCQRARRRIRGSSIIPGRRQRRRLIEVLLEKEQVVAVVVFPRATCWTARQWGAV